MLKSYYDRPTGRPWQRSKGEIMGVKVTGCDGAHQADEVHQRSLQAALLLEMRDVLSLIVLLSDKLQAPHSTSVPDSLSSRTRPKPYIFHGLAWHACARPATLPTVHDGSARAEIPTRSRR